ncbi:glycosyl hydrolase family 180 [Cordyceps javanica]|uniref:chitinase n=1 Tax=Cordyceps javanica TaxID=43265 RepID=A0A545V8Y4_9HYPO|nr:glycosyl hydrolase family 180 [Cordyceps javanica]TQW08648.1 glycosyl hydrolases family 18 [Cordyceps javanica]
MSKYTHIHFAFATVTPGSYEVDMGPTINQYYYFKQTKGAKKILSFGGWTFSTDPATYRIFRDGVLGTNRDRMAQNIANFIINEGLDGVDIDWEYPAAPDLPDIPIADPEEGENYYLFLQKLRSILPSSKSVSFAAPASFWYLRGFPISKIIDVVDYVVYMTYDLHGQWDYDNKWTDSGCPGGNCLRSHINATETMNALSMITKAGVPTNKIAVGIASYGRSFQMTDPSCTGPMCTYTGKASGATPGRCTGTAGYISNAEIRDILSTNPTARKFSDGEGGDVLVYDNNQWVSYMDDDTKARRINMYRNMNFLGTTDWAISLDNAGLVDPNSGVDDTYNDDSGDLGLGNLPGLVFKEKKRKLGKGAVQPKYHENCNKYKKTMQQSWKEAGEIADATMKWSPDNKFQRALDIYFGSESEADEKIFLGNFQRLWESHWGNQNMLGMNVHAMFFCGSGRYTEIYGKGAEFVNFCPVGRPAGTRAAKTLQFDKEWRKKSDVFTVFCDLATSSTNTWSLEEAEEKADEWDHHLKAINMWKQSVRPVIFYHENMHWQRVSDPWCGATIGTDKNGFAITEQYSFRRIMHLPYSMRKMNAENWAMAAIAMWIMDTWDVEPPIPVYVHPRDDIAADPEMDDSEGYDPEWEAEMEKAERLFRENFDPARLNPADFKPLFDDDDEQTHEVKHECSEGRWLSSLQCSLMCQDGVCTETFDGNFLCSSCNATSDEARYKREEFQDTFNDTSMSEWKIYEGHFEVSTAGLVADGSADDVALIYQHKTADFIFEGDVTLPAAGAGGDAGLIFRAANPNETETSGYYYAGISSGSGKVFLNRMPADVQLASVAATNVVAGKPVHIKVQAVNETISVFLIDMVTPKIVQKDTSLQTGFNGVRVHGTRATFNNITITPVVRQKGIVDNCNGFYRAVAGDTCQTITAKHSSVSLAQLHSWNPALQDDCSGLKADYFYCVAREDAFRLRTKYHNDCTGEVHNDVVVGRDDGKCIDTGCSVASMDIASTGDCPNGQVQISYWEQPGCLGQWFGYGYASRGTCRPLWSDGWKFGSLHLRCAEPLSDCVSQGKCVPDEEPARGICEAPPPPPAFKLKARYTTDCGGDVHKELAVEQGNGLCMNTGCRVGSLELAELGDCPDGEVRISYWGGEDCGGAWYGYGYASRNTCRSLWSAGWKFKSLWLSCAKQSDDCVSKKSCTADPEPTGSIC